jgi:predicted nucleic acid-binding Zn ribbon protein
MDTYQDTCEECGITFDRLIGVESRCICEECEERFEREKKMNKSFTNELNNFFSKL